MKISQTLLHANSNEKVNKYSLKSKQLSIHVDQPLCLHYHSHSSLFPATLVPQSRLLFNIHRPFPLFHSISCERSREGEKKKELPLIREPQTNAILRNARWFAAPFRNCVRGCFRIPVSEHGIIRWNILPSSCSLSILCFYFIRTTAPVYSTEYHF